MMGRIGLTLCFTLALAAQAAAQATVFLVRHGERADDGAGAAMAGKPAQPADPDLSAAGRMRADSLAQMLKDAGVTAIYTTEFKRTQQTAAPLALALGLKPTVVPAADSKKLIDALRTANGTVLVVGHSNTLPEILQGVGAPIPVTIGDLEYDNLFIAQIGAGATRVVRLRFK